MRDSFLGFDAIEGAFLFLGSLTGFEPALTSATNLRLSLSATNSI